MIHSSLGGRFKIFLMGGVMENFLTIGKLAEILEISTKTLRHYENEGLLIPSFKNPITKYRYYENHHIKELHIIHLLKKLGFSLKEIKKIKKDNNLIDQLTFKHNEIKAEIEDLKKKKNEIDHSIDHLQNALKTKINFQIKVMELPLKKFHKIKIKPVNFVDEIKLYEIGLKLRQMTDEIQPNILMLMHKDILLENDFNCYGLMLEIPIEKDAQIEYWSPKGSYISLIYKGNPFVFHEVAINKAKKYIEKNNLVCDNLVYSRFLLGPATSTLKSDYLTEILIKVK